MNRSNYISIISQLKESSMKSHIEYTDFIITNALIIKDMDTYLFKDYSVINHINQNTLYSVFKIKNWSELVENAILNDKISKLLYVDIKYKSYSSRRLLELFIKVFENSFRYKLSNIILQFLSNTSDNYLLFTISQWIQEYNIMIDTIEFTTNDKLMIYNLQNSENIDYIKYHNMIVFPKLCNTMNWAISHFPQYYKETKMYSLGFCYDGMGWYNVLTVSLLPENIEKPFFFRLEGGSNGYDRENNLQFFKKNQPPKHKMFNLDELIKIINENKFEQHIFMN
jgi:hypothetical protein